MSDENINIFIVEIMRSQNFEWGHFCRICWLWSVSMSNKLSLPIEIAFVSLNNKASFDLPED